MLLTFSEMPKYAQGWVESDKTPRCWVCNHFTGFSSHFTGHAVMKCLGLARQSRIDSPWVHDFTSLFSQFTNRNALFFSISFEHDMILHHVCFLLLNRSHGFATQTLQLKLSHQLKKERNILLNQPNIGDRMITRTYWPNYLFCSKALPNKTCINDNSERISALTNNLKK